MQLVDVSRALRRYWYVALLAFAAILALGVVAAYLPTERYRSSSTVLVAPNFAEAQNGAFQAVSVVLPTLAAEMESRSFADAAFVGTGLDPRDASVSIDYDTDTGLLTVQATSDDPNLAALTANALAQHAVANPPSTTLVQLRVLDTAVPAGSPYTPVRGPILGGAVVLAIIGAVFAALAAASLRRRARGTNDLLERFGTSVLGEIPPLSRLEAPGVGTVGDTVTRGRPHVVEAFQTLRTNVELVLRSAKPEIVAITSTKPREGKSTVAAHLSWVLAGAGRPVTLVDLDLRRPTAHTLLDQPLRPGVCEVGWLPMGEIVRPVGPPGLRFMPAGVPDRHPAEVVSRSLPTIISELARPDELVLLDCPSLTGVAESTLIVSASKSVILVVDAKSDIDDVEAALIRLDELGVALLGVVANRSRRRRAARAVYKQGPRHARPPVRGRARSPRPPAADANPDLADPDRAVDVADTVDVADVVRTNGHSHDPKVQPQPSPE